METIREVLETPVRGHYDVAVVGGGPAGCGVAIACGRAGLKTLLIERENCLGGGWTTGLINPFFDGLGKSGLVEEIITALQKQDKWGGFWKISFHYEYMKKLLEDLMREANVEVLYGTTFSRTLQEGNRVTGIVAENIEGRFAVLADMTADCTGNGDVAADAGCAFVIGEEDDPRACQAMTLMFLVGNIPEEYRDGLMIFEKLDRAYRLEGKEIPFRVPYLIPVPGSRFGVVQFTHMYDYDPLSARELTEAVMEGRRQIIEAFEALTKHDEDFRALELISSAGMLGVRESRRIVGEYTLTLDDIINGAQFPDAVASVTFGADLHTKSNKGQNCFGVKPYTIPMRALIPKGYDGIITAGRCISGSREAMASYRVTGNCCQMGENAGYILAQALQTGVNIRDVKREFRLRK